jgi:hypothetical protein
MSHAEIEILNWDKFNPRKDVGKPSWFRFEHSIMFDPDWDNFVGEEIAVWLFLLCFASFKNKGVVAIDEATIARRARVDIGHVRSALEKLTEKQCISITSRARNADVTPTLRERDEHDTSTCSTVRYDTVRNGTDGTIRNGEISLADASSSSGDDPPSFSPAELLEIWNLNAGPLPKAKISTERERKARVQIKKYPDKEHWLAAVSKFTASDFCVNEWRPGFDDFLSERKRLRAIEGNYDNKPGKRPDTFANRRQAANAALWQKVNEGAI